MSVYGFKPGEEYYKYKLGTLISNPANSQSDVWLAIDQATQTQVALKVMDAAFTAVPDRLYEAQFGARFKHSHLCEVVGADIFQRSETTALGQPIQVPYVAIAFRYQPKGSCTKLLSGPGMLTASQVHRLMLDVLSALEYLHNQGWQHNDIKPANILVSENDAFLLTDYGIAWEPTAGATSAACYKPHIAPESLQAAAGVYATVHTPTAYTDLYQLAVTAYRLLNGVDCVRDAWNKYQAAGQEAVFFDLVKQGKIPDRTSYHPSVPNRLRQIVNKALSTDPTKRYPSALAMRRELEKLHFPYQWQFDNKNEMFCDRDGVEHRIEVSPQGKTYQVSLVKTFPSKHVMRPKALTASGLTRDKADQHIRKIMQEALKP